MLVLWFIVPSYALLVTLLAKLCRVKVACITGGYDVVSMPNLNFGAMRVPLFRWMIRPTLALANLVLPFSQDAARQVAKYARPRHTTVVYPGVDTVFFAPGRPPREPLALAVSPIIQEWNRQKGLQDLVEAARHAPEMQFVLVGRSPDGSMSNSARSRRPTSPSSSSFLPRGSCATSTAGPPATFRRRPTKASASPWPRRWPAARSRSSPNAFCCPK